MRRTTNSRGKPPDSSGKPGWTTCAAPGHAASGSKPVNLWTGCEFSILPTDFQFVDRRPTMTEQEVKQRAFAMPLTNPAFPPGPYRFVNREFFIITYRTDPNALRAVIPAPLEFTQPLVKYEFIRMPDSTGFGDYTESGQVVPIRFKGHDGAYVH